MARMHRPAETVPSPQCPATPPARRGPVAGAVAVAALALAGCGSVTAAQSAAQAADSSSASTPAVAASHLLCARPGAVSQVAIARTGLLPRVLPAGPGQPSVTPTPASPPRNYMPRLPARPAQTPGPGVPVAPGTSATPARPRPPVGPSQPIETRPPSASTLVTSTAKARALARSVCGLPAFPRVPVNCPALIAGSYRLSFTADGRELPVVTVQDTGCQAVTGLGTVRTAASRAGFWKLLSGLAGPPVDQPVHLPGGPVNHPEGPLLPRAA